MTDFILGLARGRRALYVGTASMEDPFFALQFHDALRGRAEFDHLRFNPWPSRDLSRVAADYDVIYVAGGNTANMLAIWRVHGFERALREAWEAGVVLAGSSAGMICWFEAGLTDSFGPQLDGMECLGFLPGSACPHYDGEERRRPRYRELVDAGFPPGYAAEDGVGLHFVGTELREAVAIAEGKCAYRVEQGREEPLTARVLTQPTPQP